MDKHICRVLTHRTEQSNEALQTETTDRLVTPKFMSANVEIHHGRGEGERKTQVT